MATILLVILGLMAGGIFVMFLLLCWNAYWAEIPRTKSTVKDV